MEAEEKNNVYVDVAVLKEQMKNVKEDVLELKTDMKLVKNDVGTVKKHLHAIEGTEAEEVYRVLGRTLLSIAEKKNPDTDYTAMKKIIDSCH